MVTRDTGLSGCNPRATVWPAGIWESSYALRVGQMPTGQKIPDETQLRAAELDTCTQLSPVFEAPQ